MQLGVIASTSTARRRAWKFQRVFLEGYPLLTCRNIKEMSGAIAARWGEKQGTEGMFLLNPGACFAVYASQHPLVSFVKRAIFSFPTFFPY